MGIHLTNQLENAHSLGAQEILAALNSDREGLSNSDAEERLDHFGPNTLPTKPPPSPVVIFFSQMLSPFSLILGLACTASILFGEITDSIVIFAALAIDVTIGFIQEYRASKTFQSLLTKTTLHITVLRSGELQELDAKLLVPGDIMIIKYGDKIPADGRILSESNFKVDESILTGESLPQEKNSQTIDIATVISDRENMVFMGTNATHGSCTAVVTATGKATEIGKINEFVTTAESEKTFLQKEIDKLGRMISLFLMVLLVLILSVGIIRGNPPGEMIHEAIALAVSAIPESLAVIVTVIFAIGMGRIYRSKGLIKKLMATETLGRTEVLCLDKTGTLTEGSMIVERIATSSGIVKLEGLSSQNPAHYEIGTAATLCNQAYIDDGEYKGPPTDTALLKLGRHIGLSRETLKKKMRIHNFIPFDSETKMSIAHISRNGTSAMYICGAPEEILKKSAYSFGTPENIPMTERARTELLSLNASLGKEGYRIVAAASKECHTADCKDEMTNKLTFLGLLIISDPIRKSAKETVRLAQRAGMKLVMVTGDHPETALHIAMQVGIATKRSEVLDGDELALMSDEELDAKIEKVSVFARIPPFDKVKIINAWKRKGRIVAMTGDGVNDAPALMLADIGIALGSGTEVAKDAADLVLLNDNLQTILDAIRQGRGILDNIKKTVTYLLSDSFAEVFVVGFAILFGFPIPLLPAQILWINIVEDGLPDIALALEPVEKDAMKNAPTFYKTDIVDREVWSIAIVLSAVNIIVLLALYFYLLNSGHTIAYIRTMIFVGMSIDSLFFSYACKSLRQPFWKIRILSNKVLNFSFILSFILLLGAVYLPFLQVFLKTAQIGITEWAILLGIGFLNLVTVEFVKHLFFDSGMQVRELQKA